MLNVASCHDYINYQCSDEISVGIMARTTKCEQGLSQFSHIVNRKLSNSKRTMEQNSILLYVSCQQFIYRQLVFLFVKKNPIK